MKKIKKLALKKMTIASIKNSHKIIGGTGTDGVTLADTDTNVVPTITCPHPGYDTCPDTSLAPDCDCTPTTTQDTNTGANDSIGCTGIC
ncbi:hypothetical protein GWK08_17655 [Leptobacterium flavescens]|uniref:Uncharacterized protein n=1 Tax=Leptobacterium flavescens TaxID=472055 RepID=A0A6P0UXU8_9FLAO|nr:hypothetical protein [Leptobacterium flavescens]NER15286.1 hypothetical protein [Leptobacterium flavescens]